MLPNDSTLIFLYQTLVSKTMNFQKSRPKSILMLSYFLAKKLTSTVTLGIYRTSCLKVTCSNCIIQLSQQVYSIKLRERSVNNAPGQCGYEEHRVFLEKKHGLHLAIYMYYVVQSSFRTLHYSLNMKKNYNLSCMKKKFH